MNTREHSHNKGLKRVPQHIRQSVVLAVRRMNFKISKRCSVSLRHKLIERLKKAGWSGRVNIGSKSSISITAMRERVALCLQTGNMGRFYADLLKLQLLKKKRRVRAAIYVLPTQRVAKQMGSNIVNYERLVDELNIFAKIITVPIYVIGIR